MKKSLLSFFLLIQFSTGYGQNYQCLQSGVKHFFMNGNGYLRGIRIDSVQTSGDTIVYYPFHTPRGAYDIGSSMVMPVLDPNGGSWLGKRVLQLSDGTFIFDSYWNDSVIIKTQANIGDSWVFYKDSSSLYYKATMLANDTMTILGVPDSVKTILITANNTSGIVTSDPLDSFQVILSKNNGFVQVFDLYTFPYHKPDSIYRLGLDFFLDRSTCTTYNINNNAGIPIAPNQTITLFTLTDFINPNEQQLNNWNVGDVIESSSAFGSIMPYDPAYVIYTLMDTVASKVISGDAAIYTINGLPFECPDHAPLTLYPCAPICNAGTYTFYDNIYPILNPC